MSALLIRHRIADYPSWRQVFDEQAPIRWANGCRGGRIFRNADDPGEILILLDWDDFRRARLYSQSDELNESLKLAGIIDHPDLWVLDHLQDLPG